MFFCNHHDGFSTDHAVTIVGFGMNPKTGKQYFIIKNSFGGDYPNYICEFTLASKEFVVLVEEVMGLLACSAEQPPYGENLFASGLNWNCVYCCCAWIIGLFAKFSSLVSWLSWSGWLRIWRGILNDFIFSFLLKINNSKYLIDNLIWFSGF